MFIIMSNIRTYTRTALIFKTGETAPSAEEVIGNEGLIVNNHGNVALGEFVEDGETTVLDRTTEPPTLHLKDAGAVALFGYTDENGEFVQNETELNSNPTKVTGVYAGPGSQLQIV